MAESQLPYLNAYGNIAKALDRIQEASTPDRFTQDFLATKLDLPGGGAKPLIPFFKRTGFLGSDGVPTHLYKRFRNQAERGAAAAEALKIGYKPLFEINEYIHDAGDPDLKGVVVQVTGGEPKSTQVRAIVNSFKALRAYADFEASVTPPPEAPATDADVPPTGIRASGSTTRNAGDGVNLSYTINLNLPSTSDVAVFNAIFKSLRDHILPSEHE